MQLFTRSNYFFVFLETPSSVTGLYLCRGSLPIVLNVFFTCSFISGFACSKHVQCPSWVLNSRQQTRHIGAVLLHRLFARPNLHAAHGTNLLYDARVFFGDDL
jgi:hypothetical protein